jgi:hypothetical protein
MDPLLMLGAGNPALPPRGSDFYQTPRRATEALLSVEVFTGPIWECACGLGAISRVLEEHDHVVVSTDLIDRGYGEGGLDFLTQTTPLAPNIATNPPFRTAAEFAIKACELATGKVALLARLAWLEGSARRSMFATLPLSRVWVFSRRLPMMHREGWEGPKAASAVAFAWYVFDHDRKGRPTLGWL